MTPTAERALGVRYASREPEPSRVRKGARSVWCMQTNPKHKDCSTLNLAGRMCVCECHG